MATAEVQQSPKPRPPHLARVRPAQRREGQETATRLRETLQQEGNTAALAVLPDALAADADAARDLIAAVPDVHRGTIAVALHLHDVPATTMREVLELIAFASHDALCAAAPGLGRLAAMFGHAGTEAPMDLPETFPVWRGVRGQGVKRGAKGLVWTMDRAVACSIEASTRAEDGPFLLLAATAWRQDVGLRMGSDLVVYTVTGAHVDRERGRTIRQRGVQSPAGMPIGVEHHVQAIGAVLAAEPAADAIGTLFNAYAELPGDGERAAFVLALVAEVVVGRVAAA